MTHQLDRKCGGCDSWRWCGRQCQNAPGKKVAELMPWDDGYEEERKSLKPEKAPVQKTEVKPTPNISPERKSKQPHPQTIRFPKEVLDHFGYKTPGWQKRINDVLTEYARTKRSP